MTLAGFLITLIAIFAAAKLFGAIADRLGQPAVLGEMIGGIVVGGSGLRLVDAHDPVLQVLAQLGVVLLLFLIGLETDVRRLLAVGGASAAVAITGVVLPLVSGFAVARALGYPFLVAFLLGAALTATSVGITARVLSDLGQLKTPEAQIILGAAVLDDILGLICLAVVRAIAGGQAGLKQIITDATGSGMIIAAFAAGLLLARTRKGKTIEHAVHRVAKFFIPVFFIVVGAAVDLKSLNAKPYLLMGVLLTLVGVAGKVIAGFVAFGPPVRRVVIGVGMVPRGEVGLVFAQLGLSTGLLSAGLYGSLAFMVIVTTLITPPALRRLLLS